LTSGLFALLNRAFEDEGPGLGLPEEEYSVRRLSILFLAALALSSGGGRARAQFATGLYVTDYGVAGQTSTPGVWLVGGPTATAVLTSATNDRLNNPVGIAVSADGSHLYVADATLNRVAVYTSPLSTPTSTIALGGVAPTQPTGLALDSSGNVYVSLDNNTSTSYAVAKITNPNSASPAVSMYGPSSGISSPSGLAFDGAGHLFVGQSGTMGNGITNPATTPPHVYEIAANGSTSTTLSITPTLGGQATPGLTVDGSNNLYVVVQNTGANSGSIYRVSTNGGAATLISSDMGAAPIGVTLDASGTLYYDDTKGNIFKVTNPSGANGITPSTSTFSTALSNHKLGYLYYYPTGDAGGGDTGSPEPGSLALGVAVTLAGLVGWAVNRRRVQGAGA
jgi:sugar lactone lactonase YvrE